MAIINKTGITDGSTIQAEHVTRTIDALSGVSTDTVVATGSFSGSFKGDGSQLSGVTSGFPFTGSARITGSLAVTGSFEVSGSLNVSSTLTTINSPAIINNFAIVNGSLTVPPASATSFRPPVELLDNHAPVSVTVTEYDAATIFIADRSIGSAAIEFTLSEYDPSEIGRSYKFIFPYSGSGTVEFNDSGNSTMQGVYTDSVDQVKNITSVSTLVISDADHCVVDATAVGSDGETWFLRVVTSGTV